jgi:hypothetical protein
METAPVEAGSVETDMKSSFRIRLRRAPAESRRTSREERHARHGLAAGE